jgi:cytochrome c
MLYPDTWEKVRGFWSAITLPNVLPRYFHFITASLAVTGFFSFFLFKYKAKGRSSPDRDFYLRSSKIGILWALVATLAQAIFGLINFFTLPDVAYSWHVTLLVIIALVIAGLVSFFLFLEYHSENTRYGLPIFLLITGLILIMGTMRHMIRENALGLPWQVLAENTGYYQQQLAQFKEEPQVETKPATGKELFMDYCSACHAFDKKAIGPPVSYMREKYGTDKKKMEEFIENPVKVNPEYPEMPKLELPEEDISKIVDYIYNP